MSYRMERDRVWCSNGLFTRQTADWRDYYSAACRSAGLRQAANHLPLSEPFHPHSPNEAAAAHASIIHRQSSAVNARVILFALSYDHDASGSLSLSTWGRILSILRFLVQPDVAIQLWVDRIDSASRTTAWGIAQLMPYVLLPVVRIGSRPDAGFWSNMEGLAGIFGQGLFHDRSLDALVLQDEAPVGGSQFFVSKADTYNARDAIETFYVHLMYGCLANYRNHHQEALERLQIGGTMIALSLGDADRFLDTLIFNERNSVFGDGRFEILNGKQSRTDIPGWQGLKEWITVHRWIHPIPALSNANPLMQFRIKGFVNVYYSDTQTMAVVHWALNTGAWTRRLLVGLTHGSREDGQAVWHQHIRGYRQSRAREEVDDEHRKFVTSGMPNLYQFDSFNIRWT